MPIATASILTQYLYPHLLLATTTIPYPFPLSISIPDIYNSFQYSVPVPVFTTVFIPTTFTTTQYCSHF